MTTDDRATIRRLASRSREDPDGVPIEPIISALDHTDGSVLEQATTALYAVSKTEPERVLETVPKLVPLLESDRATVRTKAITTMVSVGEDRPDKLVPYTDALSEALKDDSALVRKGAIQALQHVVSEEPGDLTSAVPRLVPSLGSESESIRQHAIDLLESLATEQPNAIDPETVVEPLLEVLEDPYEYPTDVTYDPKMAQGEVDPSHQLRGHRILRMDAQERSENTRTRERAAATMSTIAANDPETMADVLDGHLTRLFTLVDDRNPLVRGPIVGVLAYVAEVNPAAVRPVEEKLVDALDDRVVVGGNAVWALGFIGSDRALEALRAAVDRDDVTIAVQTTAEDILADLDS